MINNLLNILPFDLPAWGVQDYFTLVFTALIIVVAIFWSDFFIVFIHKVREMVLSSDWRTFEAENANSGPQLRVVLIIIHLTSLSVFFYQLLPLFGVEGLAFGYIMLGIFAIHFVRMLITRFLSFVFVIESMYEIWVESYSWIHYMLGVLVLPLAILLTYSPFATFAFSTNIAIAFFIIAELVFFYRMFVVFYRGIVSLFYLFLYLCTLEIIPLLIIGKLIL